METKKNLPDNPELVSENRQDIDQMSNLKSISEIDNSMFYSEDNLIICNPDESHLKELSELWANLATVQQIAAPERYNFRTEEKNWQIFVRKKIEKLHNLLLISRSRNSPEVTGFLYLQSITIPSSNLILKAVIEDIYTKPQHRRARIASRMLDVALNWALKNNIKQVDLITLTKSKDLIQFYLKYIKESKHDLNLELITI